QMGVPLYFVGLGDARELRDVYLDDLQAEDSVYVNDRVVFELRVSAKGYDGLTLPVELYEKVGDKLGPRLDQKTVQLDASNKTAKVRLAHRPTATGQKVYVVKVPVQDGEVNKRNNAIDKPVLVRDAKQIKVLYVEGYRRYEYQYLKTLLERESARVKGNKSIDLKVLLLDADPDFPKEDRTARSSWPTRFRNVEVHKDDDDLWSYDVVLLGDVDPEAKGDGKMTEHLKDLADFVRERGGGLLMVAGERYAPRAYKNTPLKAGLPIDVTGDADAEETLLTETYRAERTPVGRLHPIFRFTPDEGENDQIWGRLREMYWYADGYEPKRAAEVLAVHPRVK